MAPYGPGVTTYLGNSATAPSPLIRHQRQCPICQESPPHRPVTAIPWPCAATVRYGRGGAIATASSASAPRYPCPFKRYRFGALTASPSTLFQRVLDTIWPQPPALSSPGATTPTVNWETALRPPGTHPPCCSLYPTSPQYRRVSTTAWHSTLTAGSGRGEPMRAGALATARPRTGWILSVCPVYQRS